MVASQHRGAAIFRRVFSLNSLRFRSSIRQKSEFAGSPSLKGILAGVISQSLSI